MEDPRAETSGFKESTPVMISYNKGQCNERLAQAVVGVSDRQAEACARGWLRRKEGGGPQPPASTGLDWTRAAAGAAAPWRKQQPNYVSCARRTTKAIETIFVSIV